MLRPTQRPSPRARARATQAQGLSGQSGCVPSVLQLDAAADTAACRTGACPTLSRARERRRPSSSPTLNARCGASCITVAPSAHLKAALGQRTPRPTTQAVWSKTTDETCAGAPGGQAAMHACCAHGRVRRSPAPASRFGGACFGAARQAGAAPSAAPAAAAAGSVGRHQRSVGGARQGGGGARGRRPKTRHLAHLHRRRARVCLAWGDLGRLRRPTISV